MDLALNNVQGFICHKTQQTKPNLKTYIHHLCTDISPIDNDDRKKSQQNPCCWNTLMKMMRMMTTIDLNGRWKVHSVLANVLDSNVVVN